MDKPYYQDDYVTIYLGDCREILPNLPKVDLVLTDPPYGVGIDYLSYNDTAIGYHNWCRSWFSVCPRPLVFTPGIVNLAMWMTLERPTWICAWFKENQASPSALGGFNVWEPVLVYGKLNKRLGHDAWNHLVSFRERQNGAGIFPVPKTMAAWVPILSDLSNNDDLILDPFLGSGTTAIAAKKLNRKCIGIEIEEKYCEIAANRCRQMVMELNIG